MLHIVLMLLKIIGFVIVSVLGLALLLLCVLLFVPIRYRASGNKTTECLEADGKISWLLGAVRVEFAFKDKKFEYYVRLFGVRLDKIKEKFDKKNKGKKEKGKRNKKANTQKEIEPNKINQTELNRKEADQNEIEKKEINRTEKDRTEIGKKDLDETVKKNVSKEENSKKTSLEHKYESIEVSGTEDKPKVLGKMVMLIKKIWEKCISIVTSVIQFPGKIVKRLKQLRLTISSICDKIKYWINILNEEQTKEGIALIKKQVFLLLKHILPKKIQGNIVFGFDDPSKTGQLLAGICVFYPLYYKQVNISPDFTQTIFLGDMNLSGRIYLFVLVKIALRVYFDKNIQYIKKKVMQESY